MADTRHAQLFLRVPGVQPATATGVPVRTRRSVLACVAATALGLLQAFQLPTIGYITVLEMCFMVGLPCILVAARRLALPREVKKLTYTLIAYGFLGVLIDVFKQAETEAAARQIISTYLFISCLLCMAMLSVRQIRYFRWFMAGSGLWAMLRFALGPDMPGDGLWFGDPWSFGIGTGLPLFVLSLLPASPGRGWRNTIGLALLACVALGIYFDARSTALLTLVSAAALIVIRPIEGRGVALRPARLAAATMLVLVVGAAGFGMYTTLAGRGLLGETIQQTYELQSENVHGLTVAVRPGFFVALEAVARRPLLGYGSTQEDAPEFVQRLANILLVQGVVTQHSDLIARSKIPSHSILLDAWLQTGLLGGAIWIYLLVMTLVTVPAAATSTSPLAPVCLYLCLVNAWAIPFSPGPPRVDVALGLAVMFAFREQAVRRLEPDRKRVA